VVYVELVASVYAPGEAKKFYDSESRVKRGRQKSHYFSALMQDPLQKHRVSC